MSDSRSHAAVVLRIVGNVVAFEKHTALLSENKLETIRVAKRL